MMEKREERHCPPELGGPTIPWLVYPNGNSLKSHTFCNIFEPKKTCIKRIPEMRRKFCEESSHGWLVLLDVGSSHGCSLWNPVSLETIHLPDFKWNDDDLLSCTLSSAPTEPGCMILFCYLNNLIIYCQPGDTQWTKQTYDSEDGGIGRIEHAIGFSDGTIYARTYENTTVIIDKDSFGCLSFRLLNVQVLPQKPPGMKRVMASSFESSGELFRVYLYFSGTETVKCIEVYRLDFSQMAWVKAEGLGGQAFFLTAEGRSSGSCSADQHSGLKADCIYFTIPEDKRLYVFDMKDDSISVSLPCPGLRKPWCSPFWFIPMTNRNRMVDTAKENEGRTISDDMKIMVKQSSKEMSKEEEKVETIKSLFFNLPKELQYSVATHLTSVVDYMNFRAACKPLRSIAPPIRLRSPWLTVIQKGVSFLFDPECNSIYRLNTPELFGATIRFSKDGWLLMSEGNFTMFFFDPFAKTRIELPTLIIPYCFEGICFSSVPTSSDCVIFGIGLYGPSSLIISWYRLGEEDWSCDIIEIAGKYEPYSLSRCNPVYYDGAFYCLSHEGRLGVFYVTEKWTVLLNRQPCSSTSENFMVECDGELLSVFLDECGNSTIVSKLDRTTMDWVRVKSLSDRMLFLSPSTSIAIETQEKKWQNKIFLPRVWSKKNNDVVFYSLETEKYHSFSSGSFSSCDFYGTKEQLYCSWFLPNLVWRNIP